MCGINGITKKNKILIQKMNSLIVHRGPDDSGLFCEKNLTLGHVRLSIQDLSSAGKQPFIYKHYTIVFNGEIYNFNELKEELISLGCQFKSKTDTEVILAAYDIWGVHAFEKFNGMWAFCIYDSKKNVLILSRDRFGKKPLYYSLLDGVLSFSSEIKALKETLSEIKINNDSLNEFFTYRFTFGEKTMIKDIHNFKPGSYAIFDLQKKEFTFKKNFYEIKVYRNRDSFNKAKNSIVSQLDSSVKLRMVSDVPVACFLSGGLDSSLITYFAKKYNKNLHTYSIGFDTTNELSYAKIVATALKTNHHEILVDKDSILKYIEDMVYHMDEPIGADPGFLPIFVLSKEVSKDYKVVLSGDGADEIFIGYDRYKFLQYGRFLKHLAFPSKNQIMDRLSSIKNKNDRDSFFEITQVFSKQEMKKLGLSYSIDKSSWSEKNLPLLTKAQLFDINHLLTKDFFMKADKMSSAFGLEQRTPFMDYKLVEYGLSLPISYKLNFWNEKHILKKIGKALLPKEIAKRRKHGFNVPIDYWFETTLGDKLVSLLKKNTHNLYNKKYVLCLLEDLKNNTTGFKSRNIIAQKLWSVLIFEMWYDRFFIINKK
jgi:asparagine synthase (glutamine-hydrolysing)